MTGENVEGVTFNNLEATLKDDTSVKVAGVDIDGILRGKLMAKQKFLSILKDGFGFCSVVFGWDMHDTKYSQELKISNRDNGYKDIIAIPDLATFRRIPWENNVPMFLVKFYDPDTMDPISVCPRSLLAKAAEAVDDEGYKAMAGAEYEFFNFKTPPTADGKSSSTSIARFLSENNTDQLCPITEGMFGYSVTRPVHNQDYFYGIFKACEEFKCNIESWHTESGPGVLEAALQFDEICEMADRAALFKLTAKSIGSKFDITPCFMAKPRQGLPGTSGHIHISLTRKHDNKNLFARDSEDLDPPYPDVRYLSDMGRLFLAGILDALPDIMPLLAPTINSYKRLVENFWAPVTVSWGLEHRAASIRLITPPSNSASAKSTRLEVRVGGADANPHLVMAAILACGWRGVKGQFAITVPPLGKGDDVGGANDMGERLAKSLREATARFMRPESLARKVFGDEFVEHYGGTREHECRLWEEAVTDWEIKRYIEIV